MKPMYPNSSIRLIDNGNGEAVELASKADIKRLEARIDMLQGTIDTFVENFTAGVNGAMEQISEGGLGSLIKQVLGMR